MGKFEQLRKPELDLAIKERIGEMEKQDYTFPKRFLKRDYMIVGVVVIICLIMIIWGGWL